MSANCLELREIRRSRPTAPTQVLNFSPIEFRDVEITVGCLPYGADGQQVLKQLRREHDGTHVFRRDGPDNILAVSVAADAALIGEPKKIRLKKHLGLAAALIRDSLISFLAARGRSVLNYDPVRFVGLDDLLQKVAPGSAPEWLALHVLYEIAIRPVCFFRRDPFIAAAVDVRTTRRINRTAGELIADGVALAQFYVGRRVASTTGS
jgi:hypothetical protein